MTRPSLPALLPPHDIEAEAAVLGSVLVDPDAWPKVVGLLRPGDFFREKNAWVFQACIDLAADGVGLNQVTVGHALARSERLEELGGLAYLSKLVAELATSVGVEYYAQIVRRDACYRRVIEHAQNLTSAAYRANGNLPELLDAWQTKGEELRGEAMSLLGLACLPVETLSDILDMEDEPLDAIIADGAGGAILTADGKGFIVGPPGLGKTNLSLRMARAMCEGSAVLGYRIPTPRRVLHIALEGSPRTLHRRLRKVWGDADAEAIARYCLAPMILNLADSGDLTRLDLLLERTQPDVLIIDPLRNAHPWDENKSEEAARLTAILDSIIAKHHVALILIHHSRKLPPFARQDSGLEAIRGSTALAGWVQFVLGMSRETGNLKDRFVLVWNKTRDAEELLEPLVVDFDRATLDFIIVEGAVVGGKVADDAILTAIFNAGGTMRGKELIEGFVHGAGASERTTREALRALVKAHKLIEFVAPADVRNKAKTYRLADEELELEE